LRWIGALNVTEKSKVTLLASLSADRYKLSGHRIVVDHAANLLLVPSAETRSVANALHLHARQ